MDDLDLTPSERAAFAQLAATMPDNPARASAVRALVLRRRRRRYATRTLAGVVAVSALGAGIVIAGRPHAGSAQVSTAGVPAQVAPSSGPSTPDATPPNCDAVEPAVGATGTDTAEPRVKVVGTITAVTDSTISVHAEPGGSPADITAGFATDAVYVDAGRKSTTRPALSVDEPVGLSAGQASDGIYSIDYLEVHVPDRPKSDAEADQPAPGAPGSKAGKAYGTVTAISDTTVTIQAGPDLVLPDGATSITATLAESTVYYDGSTKLSEKPAIAVGDQLAFAYDVGADGTSVISSVQLDVSTTTNANDGGAGPTDPSATFGKSYGAVTAVSDSTITIQSAAAPPGSPASITAAFTDSTRYFDGDTALSAKPTVTVGDDVGIAFSIAADGTTSLLSLELHAPAPSADGAASADRKAAIAECANAAATPHGKP